MEMGAMKARYQILVAALIAAVGPVVGGSSAAVADDAVSATPTAEDFIAALTPKPERKTRGIRLRADSAVETQPAALSEPAYVDVPMITFETNSADLTPGAREVLDQLALALQSEQLGSSRFLLEGHTDAVGSPGYNMALSEQRARAAREYLASQVGELRLEAIGRGESELLEDTDGPSEANRRVRVVNLGQN
jgi:outer membrane protein OmpA-like peptidoglycan-associated protein